MCESPSGDNATRTGLLVGSLLSSVIVLLIWIILVIVRSCGVKYKYVTLCIHAQVHVHDVCMLNKCGRLLLCIYFIVSVLLNCMHA